MDGKSGSDGRGGVGETGMECEVYVGGSGVTNDVVAGGDGGARLTVTEGVVLREVCARGTTGD